MKNVIVFAVAALASSAGAMGAVSYNPPLVLDDNFQTIFINQLPHVGPMSGRINNQFALPGVPNWAAVKGGTSGDGGTVLRDPPTTLTAWSFEPVFTFNASGTFSGNVANDIGPNPGNASGTHATSATWSTPAGNGSSKSFSVNTWAVNDYWQFTTSTVGYTSIAIQWDQTSSNTGPRDFILQYSTDGTNFFQIGSQYSVLANGTPNPAWSVANGYQPVYTFMMGAPVGAENQSSLTFRMRDNSTVSANGGVVAAAGSDRVDNVIITGVVPAPASGALLVLGGLVAARRRR